MGSWQEAHGRQVFMLWCGKAGMQEGKAGSGRQGRQAGGSPEEAGVGSRQAEGRQQWWWQVNLQVQ